MHYENRLICKRMCCEMYTIKKKKRKIAKQEQKKEKVQPNNASNYNMK